MKVLLLVGLSIVLAQDIEKSWNNFQVKFNKIYIEPEHQLRQQIFKNNLQLIEQHNKKYEQGLVSYKLGINKFADLTDAEFAAKFKIIKADEKILQSGQKYHELIDTDSEPLPEVIDWRNWKRKSVVSEVKDQGNCGGCWAFSATGAIESQLAIQTGELKSLSEQQLIDCDTTNDACGGGVVQYAYDYILKNGLTLGENYPYQEKKQSCSNSKKKEKVVWTKGYVNIIENNETDLKMAVGKIGPVSVAINAVPFKLYTEGVFTGYCSDRVDHAVLAVGYGTNPTTGELYWIIKNSWGKDWGEQGYFRVVMGRNLCGITSQACYPLITTDSGYFIHSGSFYLLIFIVLALIRLI